MSVGAPPVRVLIVDDQPPYRAAAQMLFDLMDAFEVVGEAASAEEALRLVDELSVGLVIMDINLPGMNGIEATRRLAAARPSTEVVLVSTYGADELPEDASGCGALAYVHKERLEPDVVERLWDERATTGWRTA